MLTGVELSLSAYMAAACVYAVAAGYFASVPFLGLFTAGFGAVGFGTVRRQVS